MREKDMGSWTVMVLVVVQEEASGEGTAAELGPCCCVSVGTGRPWPSSSRRSRLVKEEGMRKAK